MQDEGKEYRFFAFISYKRGGEDERYAKWLQNRLEKYRIPTEIAGIPPDTLRTMNLPRRLSVFRDKTDLGSHANLDQGLSTSLEQCRYLIVICSPRSAASPYVADEARFFMERGWQERIIPFIIDGTPAPAADESERQCYPSTMPSSLLGVALAEGSREEALIKIIARLLQVDYPLLYQRHLRAQRRFVLRLLGGALCMLALVSGLALWALDAERRATAQRNEAEALVEFLTFDLREEAFDHIPSQAQEQIIRKVNDYYEKWGADNFRAQYSRAIHLSNQANLARQDADARKAMKLGAQSLSRLESLREQYPDNQNLELAMAVPLSTLVQSAVYLGDAGQAELYADKALSLVEKLTKQKPDDPGRVRFLANSLELKRSALSLMGRYQEKLAFAEQAAATARKLVALDPADEKNRDLLADNLGEYCLELAQSSTGDALPVCREAYDIAKQLAQDDPFNIQRNIRLLGTQDNLASILLKRGKVEAQIALLQERATLLGNLIRLDPERALWQVSLAGTLIAEANTRLYMVHGLKDEALHLLDAAGKRLDALLQKEPNNEQALRMRESLERERKDAAAPLSLEEQQERYLREAQETLAAYRYNPADIQQGERARQASFILAELYFQRGLYAPALHWYEQEKEVLLELSRQVPNEPRFTVRLAASWTNIARSHQSLGAKDQAAEAVGEALALMEKAEASPTPELYTISTRALLQAADTAERRGRYADALSLSVRAVERAGKALESGQANAARRDLVFALLRAGSCAGVMGKYPQAEAMLREAAALAREAMHDADMVRFERIPVLFIECLHKLADTLAALCGTDEAAALLDEAGSVLLSVPQPTGSADYREWQNSYVLSLTLANYGLRASVELDRGDVKKAGERTLEMLRVAADAPNKTDRNMIVFFVEQGPDNMASLMANERWADARAWYRKAQEIAGGGKRPESTALARLQLARVLIQGAAIAMHDKDTSAAKERASRALQILAPLAGLEGQAGAELSFTFARSHAALGAALAAGQDNAGALAQMEKALETLRALRVVEPRQIRWRALLEHCLADSAALYEQSGDAGKAAALKAEAAALREEKPRTTPAAP